MIFRRQTEEQREEKREERRDSPRRGARIPRSSVACHPSDQEGRSIPYVTEGASTGKL